MGRWVESDSASTVSIRGGPSGLGRRPHTASWDLQGRGSVPVDTQTKVPANSHGKKNKRGETGANVPKTVTNTECLGEKEKRKKIPEQSPQ